MSEPTDYELGGREPLQWLGSAWRLRKAADAVAVAVEDAFKRKPVQHGDRDERFIVFPYMMLCGMALENLLKGIIVGRDPSGITPTGLRRGAWKGGTHSHDIAHLAHTAKIHLSEDELDVLVRFSEAVLWSGRYPIPISAPQLKRTSRGKSLRTFVPEDPQIFHILFDRFAEILEMERGVREANALRSNGS